MEKKGNICPSNAFPNSPFREKISHIPLAENKLGLILN